MTRRIQAWLNLAFRFALHVLFRLPLRPLRRGRDMTRFLDAVLAEGYAPLLPQERADFARFMNCIHCGLCSVSCPEIRAAPASAWAETWTFVGGPARSIDRAPLVAAGLTPCTACAECAAVCPTGVPIPLLASLVHRLATAPLPESSHVPAPAPADPAPPRALPAAALDPGHRPHGRHHGE